MSIKVKQLAKAGVAGAVVISSEKSAIWSDVSTAALKLPAGTSVERPSGATGLIRINTTETRNSLEYWDGTQWETVVRPATISYRQEAITHTGAMVASGLHTIANFFGYEPVAGSSIIFFNGVRLDADQFIVDALDLVIDLTAIGYGLEAGDEISTHYSYVSVPGTTTIGGSETPTPTLADINGAAQRFNFNSADIGAI